MKVFTLTERYKDGDNDVVATYASMPALARGLAVRVASKVYYNDLPDATRRDPAAVATEVAKALAGVLPGLGGADWTEDEEGYRFRYGDMVYGVVENEVVE